MHQHPFLGRLYKQLHKMNAECQVEAAWCLTNIAANGTMQHVQAIMVFVPDLISFLSGTNSVMQEQCAWALGNIMGEGKEFRTTLIQNGILQPLTTILSSSKV